MNNQYDIKKWEQAGTGNLFIWKFFLAGKEMSSWKLTESFDRDKFRNGTVKEYYLENNENKDEAVKIDIIECASGSDARETLLFMLQNHMGPMLPAASEKNIRFGDAAYTGLADIEQHILFIRANMLVVLNSIGNKDIPVTEIAGRLDEIFYKKPQPTEKGISPFIASFSLAEQISILRDRKAQVINIKVIDLLERPVWFKFFIEKGEIFSENDQLFFTGDTTGNKLSVFATSENGFVSEKTIDLETGN